MQDQYRTKKIKIFKNGDIFTPPKKIILSMKVYRNFEQFLHNLSNEMRLVNGAVRRIYSIEGKPVYGFEGINDDGVFVVSGGEAFKKAPYLVKELSEMNNQKKIVEKVGQRDYRFLGAVKSNQMLNKEKETPIFQSTSKAFRITSYRNGDTASGIVLTLSHKTCKTFDQLQSYISTVLHLRTDVIYDGGNGKKVRKLDDLKEHQILVGAPKGEFFKPRTYQAKTKSQPHEQKDLNAARKFITFYPNGDSYHNGFLIPIQKIKYPTIQKLLDHINEKFALSNGPIRQIYSIQAGGHPITSIDLLLPSSTYALAPTNEPFFDVQYNVNSIQTNDMGTTGVARGLAGFTKNNSLMDKIRISKPIWDDKLLRREEEMIRIRMGGEVSSLLIPRKLRQRTAKKMVVGDGDEIEEEIVGEVGGDAHEVFESKEVINFNAAELENSELKDNAPDESDHEDLVEEENDEPIDLEEEEEEEEEFEEEEIEQEIDIERQDNTMENDTQNEQLLISALSLVETQGRSTQVLEEQTVNFVDEDIDDESAEKIVPDEVKESNEDAEENDDEEEADEIITDDIQQEEIEEIEDLETEENDEARAEEVETEEVDEEEEKEEEEEEENDEEEEDIDDSEEIAASSVSLGKAMSGSISKIPTARSSIARSLSRPLNE